MDGDGQPECTAKPPKPALEYTWWRRDRTVPTVLSTSFWELARWPLPQGIGQPEDVASVGAYLASKGTYCISDSRRNIKLCLGHARGRSVFRRHPPPTSTMEDSLFFSNLRTGTNKGTTPQVLRNHTRSPFHETDAIPTHTSSSTRFYAYGSIRPPIHLAQADETQQHHTPFFFADPHFTRLVHTLDTAAQKFTKAPDQEIPRSVR
ncbi:hypothetical protein ARMSODRAFT_975976 [Armillaria solidipes]|uniref:Uncharacterized protein n=1 Tax=Armillaria solidipes TaxID=1076256 RepID=A0A2H3BI20_9AGAR|nr:hypothetical protein ARMSODRAFT_975976 [Armillaria solidipes]